MVSFCVLTQRQPLSAQSTLDSHHLCSPIYTVTPVFSYSCALFRNEFSPSSAFPGSPSPPRLQEKRRTHFPSATVRIFLLNPFLATDPKNAPVSPIIATHPKTVSFKSFGCHTSKKRPGGTLTFPSTCSISEQVPSDLGVLSDSVAIPSSGSSQNCDLSTADCELPPAQVAASPTRVPYFPYNNIAPHLWGTYGIA